MPAELFRLALACGLLLLWAALRASTGVARVAWSLGIAFGALVGSQVLAVVMGLASGARDPEGWRWASSECGWRGAGTSSAPHSAAGRRDQRRAKA